MTQENYGKELSKELGMALRNMQSQVIGLFRPKYYPADQYIPVIANDDGLLTCIEVGTLLGLSTLNIGVESGTYVKFPDTYPANIDATEKTESTLAYMLTSPIFFNNWYKENVYPGK